MTWSNGQIINPNTYNLVETENGFSVSFKSDDVISDMFTIEYQTSFDPSIDNFYHENNKYIVKNNANHYWSDAEGNIYTSFAEDSAPISQNLTSDATKGSFFNAKEGLITWSIAANYRQQKLFNAHIIDTISDDQEIVAIRLYEANISAQGVATKVNDTLKNIEIPIGKTIDISLPNDSIKTYILEIDTKPNSRQNEIVYNNKAIYRKNLVEAHVEAELKPYYSNNHLEKNATPNFHAVDWEVFVNMAQSTLLEPVIKDIPSLNQVIHENSIKVELLELRSDNQPGYVSAVEVGKDVYNYVLHMDQMTGQQTLTINFLGEITSAYRITYKTSIINNGGSTSVEVSNSVSLEGKEKEIIETITSEKTTVETIYGSATSKEARVTLKKIDSVNENVTLQGVKLELWSTVNGIADVKLREGVTDENGQVTFGALRTETDYKIFEKNARPGYTIDEQLIYGNKKENGLNARIENDDLKNNGIIISVKNDVTKVQFKKVGSNALNSGLKDAKFIVTRLNDETTEYYLGLNSNRIAQWSNNKDDALKIISEVNGSVVVEGLSQFDKGLKLIEISAPDGYIMDENKAIDFVMVENENKTVTIEEKPQDIINTQIPRINLRINKQWNDGNNADGIRPEEIKVKLFADNVEVGEATLGQHNGWKYTFTNLLEYSKTSETSYSNEKIKYTIVEATVTNVIPETIDNTKIEHTYESTSERNNNTFNITNTHDYAKTSISGLKTWPTGIEEHGNRPSSITIELLANGVKVDSQIVSSDTNWTYHFENKPLRAKGYTINYTVSEAKVLNYTPIYSNNNRDVTNTYTPEMTSLSGRKIWDDGIEADFSRPESIQIEVYGVNKEEPVRTITVDNQSRNSWNFKVDNLRKYENQQIIEYTFKEVNVDSRYTPTYNKSTQTITNSYTPEVVDVEGLKVWSDTNNQDGKRPSEITVDLLANGIKVDTKTFTLKSDGKFVFTNVRKNYNSGQPIIYAFREHAVKDYVTTYSEDTKTITNTHAIEHINIEVNKHWNDADNQDGVRPNNVTVILKADDKEIQRQLLNADNNWTHTFENLPKYLENEQGKLINYTVEEVQLTEAHIQLNTNIRMIKVKLVAAM